MSSPSAGRRRSPREGGEAGAEETREGGAPEGRASAGIAELEQALRASEAALADELVHRDQFLAMLGHELRNPLAAIQNAISVLGMLPPGAQERERMRDVIRRQSVHMSRIIDDLLDVSRVARGKIRLEREVLDLTDLVRGVVADFQEVAARHELTVELDAPGRPVWVDGDPTRLSQVFGGLVDNALKFSRPGGRVAVKVERTAEQRVRVAVQDSGIGMEPELVPRVFDIFRQADRSLDRSGGGLGLGLALVRGMVDLHGGEVTAHSAGPDRGSEFVVWLPAADRPRREAPEGRPEARGGQRRVLVIDDNRDSADSLRMLLEIAGHEVGVAYDGPSGLEAMATFRPDVVLCDIGLPGGMSGYDVAGAIRSEHRFAPRQLVALTGYGREEDRRRAREAGFDQHLTKPVDMALLHQIIETDGQ